MQTASITMRFPFKGVDGAAPLSAMPEGACPDMLNMFPVALDEGASDVARFRMVGAKRRGLTAGPSAQAGEPPGQTTGLFIWDTLINLSSGPIRPTYLVMTSGTRIRLAQRGGSDIFANFGPRFAEVTYTDPITTTSKTCNFLQPTFAQLGSKLFIVGRSLRSFAGSPRNSVYLDSATTSPTSATYWNLNSQIADADLCCAFRARAVIAKSGGTTFYASKVGDGTNFTPSTDLTSAYIGNATGLAGVPGDSITALIAAGDDFLIFGCSSSMWIMKGDPRSGGRVENLTQRVGVFDRLAWCFDPSGTLWFLGTDYGLYKLERGATVPVEVLHGRGDPHIAGLLRLGVVGGVGTLCQLVYDVSLKCVLILFTTFNTSTFAPTTSQNTHVAYMPSLDGLYLFQFGSDQVPPFCAVSTDWGETFFGGQGDTNTLITVARWNPRSATYSDYNTFTATSAAYPCRIRFSAIEIDGGSSEWSTSRFDAVGSDGSGSATAYWLTGRSADEVMQKDYTTQSDLSFTLFGTASGRQGGRNIRARGAAHQLVIASSSTTAVRLESFRADLSRKSRQKGGV